jgi:hypothetical protein
MKLQATRSKYALFLILAIVILGFIGLRMNHAHHNKHTQQANKSAALTVAIAPSGIKYPTGWYELSRINPIDKQAGVVSAANHTHPVSQVIVRVADGALPSNFDIKTLPAETVNKLKSSLMGFKLTSDGTTSVGNNQAVSITYTTSDSRTTYEYTELIVPTANKSFYLTISAKQADFQKSTNDLSKISANFGSYITAHQ